MNKKFMAVLLALALIVGMVPATIDNVGSFAKEKDFEATPVDVVDQKTVTVTYKTSTGIQKGNVERIKVAKDATEVDVNALQHVPEGFTVVGQIEIKGNYATAIVEPVAAPKSREITVNFKTADGVTVETQKVDVEYGKLMLTVMPPKGYDLADTNNVLSIDDSITVVDVQVIKKVETSREVTVNFKTADGVTVETQKVDVEYGKLILTVTPPKGYDLADTNNVLSIDDKTTEVNVQVIKKVPTSREITVNYKTADGVTVGTEKVDVKYGKLTLTVKAPEGYDLADTNNVLSIDDKTTVVDVQVIKKAPTSREITVNYKTADGETVKTEKVDVEYGKLTLTVMPPKGYDLADTNNVLSIDDKTTVVDVQVIKQVPKSRYINVYYKDPSGETVGTQRQDVEYGRLTITVTPPKGYDLVDTNNVISIDDKTTEVEVQVIKQAPKSRSIRVNYVLENERQVGNERVEVPYTKESIVATDLKRIPEGYELAENVNKELTKDTKEVDVLVKAIEVPEEPTSRLIRVNYVLENEKQVGSERIDVPYTKESIVATDLKRIPEGYELAENVNKELTKDTKEVDVLVKAIEVPEEPVARTVRIYYRDRLGMLVASELVEVEPDCRYVKVKAPEGYVLVVPVETRYIGKFNELTVLVKKMKDVPVDPDPDVPVDPDPDPDVPVDPDPDVPVDPDKPGVEIPWEELTPATPIKPEEPEVKPEEPEVKPEKPEIKPEEKPVKPEVKPADPEVKPADKVKPVKKDTAKADTAKKADSKTPKTGDSAHVGLWVSLVAVSGALIFLFRRRRNS